MTTGIPASSSRPFHLSMTAADRSWKHEELARNSPEGRARPRPHREGGHYLTGVVEDRELHGALEVLLQDGPQALVQPGLGVVHGEDDRLRAKDTS